MPYLWANRQVIQDYLDAEGTIKIKVPRADGEDVPAGENFEDASAQRYENEAVYEIATLLSIAFEPHTDDAEYTPVDFRLSEEDRAGVIDVGVYSETPLGFKLSVDEEVVSVSGTDCPNYLCLLTARLAASKIAEVRLGASLSTLPNWVRSYKNEVYAQIQRLLLNAQTTGMKGLSLRSDFDMSEVLIKMKTREHTAVVDLEN